MKNELSFLSRKLTYVAYSKKCQKTKTHQQQLPLSLYGFNVL